MNESRRLQAISNQLITLVRTENKINCVSNIFCSFTSPWKMTNIAKHNKIYKFETRNHLIRMDKETTAEKWASHLKINRAKHSPNWLVFLFISHPHFSFHGSGCRERIDFWEGLYTWNWQNGMNMCIEFPTKASVCEKCVKRKKGWRRNFVKTF